MTLEDDLRDLRTRRSQALTKKVRADTELESAEGRLATAKETLKEHGAETPKDAKARLAELQAQLDAKTREIDAKLIEAGA